MGQPQSHPVSSKTLKPPAPVDCKSTIEEEKNSIPGDLYENKWSVEHLMKNKGCVDMRLVTIALWKNRNNPAFIGDMCRALSTIINEVQVLDQVEFYLPQLAHMVIHLETELPISAMEQFVMLVAQSSVHFALQFFWIVYATLDENRPKLGGNPKIFMRCAQLLLTLEQCLVYGSPVAQHAHDLYTKRDISKGEMEEILMADRRFFAVQNASSKANVCSTDDCMSEGWVLKKGGGTSRMGRRNWNLRWIRIERRILLVYNKDTDIHARAAIPIDRAEVNVLDNPKHQFYFEIFDVYSETKLKFCALSEQDLSKWVENIREAASAPIPPSSSPTRVGPARTIAKMSTGMRHFILDKDEAMNIKEKSSSSCQQTKMADISDINASQIPIDSTKSNESRHGHLTRQNSSKSNASSGSEVSGSDFERKDSESRRFYLNEEEHHRYKFFTGQMNFVKSITDICEDLRFVEVPLRKACFKERLATFKTPDKAFLPLCKSTDIFCTVVTACKDEGHVFTTNERVPCLMYFETHADLNEDNISQALYRYLYGSHLLHSHDIASAKKAEGEARSCSSTVKFEQSSFEKLLYNDKGRMKKLNNAFGELWWEKEERLRQESSHSSSGNWQLSCLIAKSNDDLRQEVFVMQLISFFQDVFSMENLPLRLHPYRILSTGARTGLIEVVRNANSLDGIKKTEGFSNLRDHFEYIYGDPEGDIFKQASLNFIHSLAAYSIVCYILAIKDRHNGNILIDTEGHIVHIDFGFLLGRAPGGSFSFEKAPFKLTTEMVDTMGGKDSSNFKYFIELCVKGALAIRKNSDTIFTLVEVMSYRSSLPCFQGNLNSLLGGLRDRLFSKVPEDKVPQVVEAMVSRSYDHFGTNKYDQFQVFSNGIAK